MSWLIILVLLLLLVLSYLLLAPFFIELDSASGLCRFRFHRLASARLYITESSLFIDLKIMWWHKNIDLFAPRKKVVAKKQEVKKKKSAQIPIRKIWSVVKSFKVNKCLVNIDTGNMPLNGILYPAFFLLGWRTGKNISINFNGENEIIFKTQNNLARMLWAYINS